MFEAKTENAGICGTCSKMFATWTSISIGRCVTQAQKNVFGLRGVPILLFELLKKESGNHDFLWIQSFRHFFDFLCYLPIWTVNPKSRSGSSIPYCSNRNIDNVRHLAGTLTHPHPHPTPRPTAQKKQPFQGYQGWRISHRLWYVHAELWLVCYIWSMH